MSESHQTIGVIGAGAFGTALAIAASRAGRRVVLWGRDADAMARAAADRHVPHLPGIVLPGDVHPISDLPVACATDAIIVATPTQSLAEVLARAAPLVPERVPLICAAKGIERGTGRFVADILRDAVPASPACVISGPGFAPDIAGGAPNALTLAAEDVALATALARALGSPTLRLYPSGDVRGVEIGGAAKNVIAIAAGIAAGKGFGESTVAALLARGFAELTRFGLAHGAQAETLAGLSGLGDLILTGTSSRSRNRRLGEALGAGRSLDEAVAAIGLAEGAWTAPILVEMAHRSGVEMPLSEAVAALIDGRLGVEEAITRLLARPVRGE